ncbi:Ger(x)C family spore germination protein [Sporosarcina sp. OR05]|uniref:Ger(x)C family spore germination protein n=1 Tax=Sporosarcina sp. OR05 TaxID=2969819 RepID=UPI00352A98BB
MQIKINNKLLTLLLLMAMFVLSGCWDDDQPERMLYINGIGVDFKDGQYEVYAQIMSFANIAKSDQPPGDQPQVEVGHAKGATMDEAIYELYHSVDQKVFWGHFSYIVVSEEVLKKERLSPIIDSFIRDRETRYQIWVYTTKDPVQEVLLVRPVINRAVTLSKLGDPENSFKQESFIQPLNVRKLIINLNEPSHEALIPLIAVEENWRSSKEPIKAPVLSGVGAVTPTGFKGFIETENARGIQWMSKEMKRGEVTFRANGGDFITVVIENLNVQVHPIVQADKVQVDIELKLNATVYVMEGNPSIFEIQDGIKKEIKKEIQDTYEAALEKGIDVYRFSEKLYRKDLKAWKKVQKEGRVELSDDTIRKVTVSIEKLDSERKTFRETIEQ